MRKSVRRGTRGLGSRRILVGLAAVGVFAGLFTVTQISSAQTRQSASTLAGAATIECPTVSDRLGSVPAAARAEVDRNLALLDTQLAEANRRLAAEGKNGEGFINNAILGPLASKRGAAIDRMAIAIGRVAARPQGLDGLARCTLKTAAGGDNDDRQQNNDGGQDDGDQENNGGQQDNDDQDNGQQDNGLDVLANDCSNSRLTPHDGFQNGNRCVSTGMGEVGSAERNPSLLITEFPNRVGVNQGFTLRVSTRNLVRDRFLAAGQGGYYVESSLLNEQGLVRGHFHTACRMLTSTNVAPDPAPVPAFFVATEDSRGGAEPDQVEIRVSGLPQRGIAQCAVWAGDGSHRIPMMQRANQTPALDAVRIQVG